ncbi:DUF1674 domain-containing protein [Sphingomonas qilianensis]|uniref:DUF1674 domain-containing protein n=1 Tax=Sphingomonas qilianensis TaxID=1736690 RepID=A0ABU9XT91_9SPHN
MGQRPAHVKPPAYLSNNSPVPAPDPLPNVQPDSGAKTAQQDHLGLNPTRYGDWELKGIAIDF